MRVIANYVNLTAGHLSASESDRRIEGLVVPFDEIGYASIDGVPSKLRFEAGAVVWEDPHLVPLVVNHTGDQPTSFAGRAQSLEDIDAGVWGTFAVPNTTAGNDALVEASEDFRSGLSIEADLPEPITPDDQGVVTITASNPGVLRRVALVETPAFATARVHKAAAARADGQKPADTKPATAAEVPDEDLATVLKALTEAVTTLNTAAVPSAPAPVEEAPPAEAAASYTPPMPARAVTAGVAVPREMPTAGQYFAAFLEAAQTRDSSKLDRIRKVIAADQALTNNAGIIPTPILGPVTALIDASRPVVSSMTAREMPLKGSTFKRPRITQHTTVAAQAAEHDALSSQVMTITGDTVTKGTYGGYLSMSEQDIDWTEPELLQIVLQDLADQYAIATDNVAADGLVTAATGSETADVSTSAAFVAGLAIAASESYAAAGILPDTLWAAPAQWAELVGMTDTTGRPVFPMAANSPSNALGTSEGMVGFGGNPLGLKLIVDANFATGTLVLGPSKYYEYFEQNKGQATIDAPSTLGVVVAYRGYFATYCPIGAAFIEIDTTA